MFDIGINVSFWKFKGFAQTFQARIAEFAMNFMCSCKIL